MPSFNSILNSKDFPNRLVEVEQLLQTAEVKTTFFGSRVVKIDGFSGSVKLVQIARKISVVSSDRCDADNLSLNERIAGLDITRKLEGLYSVSDRQIKDSNFLKKFSNWIREFSFSPYTTRFFLGTVVQKEFRAYSEKKFLEQFGGTFDVFCGHPSSDGCFGSPFRACAKEDSIRKLAKDSTF